MRKQKTCENKKVKINICKNNENENFVENFVDRCKKHLQINMMKRSIFRTKQKQQNNIDFANVCCFKFFEFVFFEFLLIDAF